MIPYQLLLSEDFSMYSPVLGIDTLEHEQFQFSGGEPHIKLNVPEQAYGDQVSVIISIRLKTFNDLGLLAVAVDALKRELPQAELVLFTPYFPGARQDRIMVPGEPLTVKVYADMINAMGFTGVMIMDPHSDVTPALLNKSHVLTNYNLVRSVISSESLDDYLLISPDAGSNKKISGVAKDLGLESESIVRCDKDRDVATGKIKSFEVYANDLEGKDCIIIDDICDGGGTFLGLAQELKNKNAGRIFLVVTHGIFSKGFDAFTNFEKIYTTDSFLDLNGMEEEIPQLEIIKTYKLI
jgi:ribose-phosphate pyrophosphokinase